MNKSLHYKLRDSDYFGAYTKVASSHQLQSVHAPLVFTENPSDLSLVFLNQIELDNPKSLRALEKLLDGLEAMRPRMIIVTGRLYTERACENENFDKFKGYVEQLG